MISRWHLYLARRALTTRIPFANLIRRVKRRATGYRPDNSNIGSTLSDLARLYALMRSNGVQFRGDVLEIGSGWFPIAGIIACLGGANRVFLTDQIRYMDRQTFLVAKQIVLERLITLSATFEFDINLARQMLTNASAPEDLGMIYLAPFNMQIVPDGSLDLVMSRACLEHIPRADLEQLIAALRSKLKRDGFMVHAIDNSDHLSHLDPTLSRVNFLKWTEAQYRLICKIANGGENRLRHREYADVFRRTGYTVVGDDTFIHSGALEEIPRMKIRAPYNSMSAEELATVTSWYVLKAR